MIVLRVLCAKYGIKDPRKYLEERIGKITWDENTFCPSLAGRKYIDFILYDQPLQFSIDQSTENSWRDLTQSEKDRYRRLFESIIPDIDMDDVVKVRCCWYDGVNAPDKYKEIPEPDYFDPETEYLEHCPECGRKVIVPIEKTYKGRLIKGKLFCPVCASEIEFDYSILFEDEDDE